MEQASKLVIVMNNDKTFYVDTTKRTAINFMELLNDANAVYSFEENGYEVIIPVRSIAYARVKLGSEISPGQIIVGETVK